MMQFLVNAFVWGITCYLVAVGLFFCLIVAVIVSGRMDAVRRKYWRK